MRSILSLLALCLCAACAQESDEGAGAAGPTENAATTSPVAHARDPLVGVVWVLEEEDGRPGPMRVFLEDGTLIQDSCWETYRLSEWRRESAGRVIWNEDGMDIPAVIVDVADDALTLRLELVGEEKTERYRRASAPYVCPDMPR